jgi:Ni,Fe-hydrogenase III small subunit
MFALLRDLRRLRLQIGLPPPTRGRSLAIRHVDAGSCNACEHELTLAAGPHYDLAQYGLNVVASPRHADLLLVTGPVTSRMREALLTAYLAMPEPRRVAALGDCALGCGVLGLPETMAGRLEDVLPIDLRIPGCPPDPQRIAESLLQLLDGRSRASDPQDSDRVGRCPRNGGEPSEPGQAAGGVSDG